VVTYHYDNARTGANLSETVLTPANVNAMKFGKIGFFSVDGKVDGQPVYLSQVSISGGTHNVLYVVSEHDSVYAFDADNGTVLWHVSLLGSGETTSDPHNCSQIAPEIGITSTPVIDRSRGPHGALYTVAMSKNGTGNYFQRIHALDVTTGAELFGGPTTITAAYPGTGDNSTGGSVVFDARQYAERAGLLLLNGTVYTTWTSHCDQQPYTGWIIGYDANTLAQTKVLNVTPNGSEGSIWMSGTAPAADSNGNIYALDANGTFDITLDANGFPSQHDFGNSFLKLSTSSGLSVADYFTMSGTITESNNDEDLGSGGAIVLPDLTDNEGQVHQLAVGAGKDRVIYIVDRNAMGKFNPSADNIYQEIPGVFTDAVFSMPAYFNNTVYYGPVGNAIKAFPISNAKLATTPSSNTGNAFPYPGATPSISANGTSNAIVWAVENSSPAVLHAYDATNLANELYNSSQASASRDQFGPGNKFITPMIVNGKVYVGTPTGVAVFGLLP
jgi:outer membrane protein assembly factor BamB